MLVPIAVGSTGATVYLTSQNSISNFSKNNTNPKNVSVKTRINPLASSQTEAINDKTENLDSQKPTVETVEKTITEILPKIAETAKNTSVQNLKKSVSPAVLLTKKQDHFLPKAEQKPKKTAQILVLPEDRKALKLKVKILQTKANKSKK
ncbi:hypothetical protein MDIS_02305 [Mesomycoplasma dispar]|nr:hypothetical protein MDIS_02305 [Mesomycoplasma dispar]